MLCISERLPRPSNKPHCLAPVDPASVAYCAMQLMGNLDFPQAVEEIKQAAKWLREQGAPKVPDHSICMFLCFCVLLLLIACHAAT